MEYHECVLTTWWRKKKQITGKISKLLRELITFCRNYIRVTFVE